MMKVTEIRYTEARLISTATYENARVEFGVSISISEDADYDRAIDVAQKMVRDVLVRRIIEMEDQQKRHAVTEVAERVRRKHRL
jgi:hypothetical protein